MSWNNNLELEVKRRIRKISIQANNGELVGPELESAILDVFRHAWDRLDTDAPTLREALDAVKSGKAVQ